MTIKVKTKRGFLVQFLKRLAEMFRIYSAVQPAVDALVAFAAEAATTATGVVVFSTAALYADARG